MVDDLRPAVGAGPKVTGPGGHHQITPEPIRSGRVDGGRPADRARSAVDGGRHRVAGAAGFGEEKHRKPDDSCAPGPYVPGLTVCVGSLTSPSG